MKKFLCFAILLSLFVFMPRAKASSYTPSQNLYDSTQANYLVSMAYNQVKSFTSQSYVVFQPFLTHLKALICSLLLRTCLITKCPQNQILGIADKNE